MKDKEGVKKERKQANSFLLTKNNIDVLLPPKVFVPVSTYLKSCVLASFCEGPTLCEVKANNRSSSSAWDGIVSFSQRIRLWNESGHLLEVS